MPILLKIIPWVIAHLKYIKYLFITLLILALFLTPYYIGKADGKRAYKIKCQSRALKLEEAAKAEVLKLQTDIDTKADEYDKDKQERAKQIEDYKRKYINEKAKNPVYSNCRAGTDFMRYYEKAASYDSTASGEAAKATN